MAATRAQKSAASRFGAREARSQPIWPALPARVRRAQRRAAVGGRVEGGELFADLGQTGVPAGWSGHQGVDADKLFEQL